MIYERLKTQGRESGFLSGKVLGILGKMKFLKILSKNYERFCSFLFTFYDVNY